MDPIEFNRVVRNTLNRTEQVLVKKAEEYSTNTDRLHNFKIASSMQKCTPAQALGGMMAKHTTSIYDMIRSGKSYSAEVWDEKINDHINYLVLLRAIVEEQRQDEENQLDKAVSEINWDIPTPFNKATGGSRNLYNRGEMADETEGDRRSATRGTTAMLSIQDVRLPSRDAAEDILDKMTDFINEFGEASVADLYDLLNLTGEFADSKWGWDDFNAAHVARERSGYSLQVPKPKLLVENNKIVRTEDDDKATQDQTALNDLAAHLAKLSKKLDDNKRNFRATDLNEVFNIVERVRVIDPKTETERLIDE